MKTVLITGANKGIGFATAQRFAQEGYQVLLAGRNIDRLKSAATEIGGHTGCLLWDISDIHRATEVIDEAHQLYGDISVFINNAGIVHPQDWGDDYRPIPYKTEKCWDETMNINLKGAFFAIQAEVCYMKKHGIHGNIVNLCSEMGFRPALDPYAISKWGVRGMTMGFGREFASDGIVVNGIAPGQTATEILLQTEGEVHQIDTPRGIQAQPREIAQAIFFLASSRNIIGEVLISDGGESLR